MIIRGKAGLAAAAAGSLVAFATLPGQPASAQQLLFDWGGSGTIGGSGREVVAFSPKFAKGEIIVSFGDRKLYFITQPGRGDQLSDCHPARAEPLAGRHVCEPEAGEPVLDARLRSCWQRIPACRAGCRAAIP